MLRPTVIFVLSLHSGARAQPSYAAPMIKQVVTAARARPPIVTDKVTTHSYQTMYGMFLVPLYYSTRSQFRRMKMLEIGLGCDQNYGPGASAKLWRDLFADMELWMADTDAACVSKHNSSMWKDFGIRTLVGDQASKQTQAKWVREAGDDFDAIIDDGGHTNGQILSTFRGLWPSVKRGGLYFIEDMLVGRHPKYDDTKGDAIMSDVIQSWIEQLTVNPRTHKALVPDWGTVNWDATASNRHAFDLRKRFPLPRHVNFIFCQREACVIGKQEVR